MLPRKFLVVLLLVLCGGFFSGFFLWKVYNTFYPVAEGALVIDVPFNGIVTDENATTITIKPDKSLPVTLFLSPETSVTVRSASTTATSTGSLPQGSLKDLTRGATVTVRQVQILAAGSVIRATLLKIIVGPVTKGIYKNL